MRPQVVYIKYITALHAWTLNCSLEGGGPSSQPERALEVPALKKSTRISVGEVHRARGFSVVELVIAVAVILVISAVALPSLTRIVRIYQLNDAAVRLAGILKFTRFQAIRRNSPITCVNAQGGANAPASVWSDDNGDGVEQPAEKQIVLGNNNTLVPASAVPDTAALATAAGAGTLTATSPSSGGVRFDQRGGAVPPAVYVFYVGNTTTPDSGFRAVIVLPSGSVQVWSYPGGAGSAWHKIS